MLSLQGKLVAAGLAEVRPRLAAPPPGEGPVDVDLSAVVEIDSAGVAMLVLASRR
ncbi:MAG: STAS domain-containing protein [Myxococcales bacterium]|nr:STAS domain-containing protein [Myxococcales bacterium]